MLFTMSVRYNALEKSHQRMQHCTEVVVEAVPRGVALRPIHTVEPGLLLFPYFSSVTTYVIHTKCGSWNRWSCIIPDSLTVGNPPRRCELGIKVSSGGEDMGWDFPWGVFVSRVGSSRQGVLFFFCSSFSWNNQSTSTWLDLQVREPNVGLLWWVSSVNLNIFRPQFCVHCVRGALGTLKSLSMQMLSQNSGLFWVAEVLESWK